MNAKPTCKPNNAVSSQLLHTKAETRRKQALASLSIKTYTNNIYTLKCPFYQHTPILQTKTNVAKPDEQVILIIIIINKLKKPLNAAVAEDVMISNLRISGEVTNDTCIQDGGRDGELKRQFYVLKNNTRLC